MHTASALDSLHFDADADPDPESALEKKWIRIQVTSISLRFANHFKKQNSIFKVLLTRTGLYIRVQINIKN